MVLLAVKSRFVVRQIEPALQDGKESMKSLGFTASRNTPLEFLISYLGDWVWYTPGPLETLRYTLYLINTLTVVLLLVAFSYLFYVRKTQGRFHDRARRRIFPALLAALALWALEYGVLLFTYDPLQASQAKDAFLKTRDAPLWQIDGVLNLFIALFFAYAGLCLLSLGQVRIHSSLAQPTARGISLPRLSRLATKRQSVPLLSAGFVLLFAVGLLAGRNATVTLGALMSCLGLAILGLGLLRELNRERRDLVSCLAAASILAYALVQLGQLIPPLTFWIYSLAVVLKLQLLLAGASFWVLIGYGNHARRDEQRRMVRDMIDVGYQKEALAKQVHLRHELRNKLTAVGLALDGLKCDTSADQSVHREAAALARQIDDVMRITESALIVTEPLVERPRDDLDLLGVVREVLSEQLAGQPAVHGDLRVEGVIPLFDLPRDAVRWPLARVIENAVEAGASRLRITFSENAVVGAFFLDIWNDGKPIPPHITERLFLGPYRGLWAARRIVSVFGGDLRLVSNDESGCCFRFVLPPPRSVPLGAAVSPE